MKSLLGLLLALSLCIAPGFADMKAMSANATASACGEESCGLDRRGSMNDVLNGNPTYEIVPPPFDYYCNTKDERKACRDKGDDRFLTSAMCRSYCNCNLKEDGSKGSITCSGFGDCTQKTMEDTCKCWGVVIGPKDKGKELCGNAPLESQSTKTQRPAATVAANAGKIF